MDEYERYMSLDPSVGRTFSVADLLATNGAALREFQPKWAVLPTTKRQAGQLIGELLAGASPLSTAYILTPRRDATQVTVYAKDRQGENVERLVIRTQRFFDDPAHKVQDVQFKLAAGIIGELAAANQEIIKNDVRLNVLAFATIFLIILFTYRSVVAGLYLLFPLALANAAINAYMGAHDIGININTLPVVTVGVGFGIDYAIYVVSRIIEELALGHDINEATYLALITSGKAVVFTALTLVASVLFWYWSDIRFDAEMGMLLAVWMFVSMLGCDDDSAGADRDVPSQVHREGKGARAGLAPSRPCVAPGVRRLSWNDRAMKLEKLDHFGIEVRDLQRAERFYVERARPLAVVTRFGDQILLDCGGQNLALFEVRAPSAHAPPSARRSSGIRSDAAIMRSGSAAKISFPRQAQAP